MPRGGIVNRVERGRILRVALGLVVLPLWACGDEQDANGTASANVAVDTLGDTIRVFSRGTQRWASDRRMVSQLVIGGLQEDDAYQFGSIRGLAVAGDGRILVVDGLGPTVRTFAPDGTYLHDIGRAGEGPGEYLRLDGGIAALPDGGSAIRDPGNGRISLFDARGEYQEALPLGPGFTTSSPLFITDNGTLLTQTVLERGVAAADRTYILARYRPDRGIDTVLVPVPDLEPIRVTAQGGGGRSSFSPVPFTPELVWTYSPRGYFVWGVNDQYSVILDRVGEPILRFGRSYDPVPVTTDEAAAHRSEIERRYKIMYPGWSWNGPSIPSVKPPFRQIVVGLHGRIWVRLHVPGRRIWSDEQLRSEEESIGYPLNPFREPVVFDVFEADGTYLGQVETPDGFRADPVPVIRGDTVWAVVQDALEVARIHRFELGPALD